LVARTVTDRLAVLLKQPVVLENKPGAGGNIGAMEVARSAPDGYTWMLGTDTIVTVNPHVYRNMPFKPEDFKPVAILSQFGQTLVCHPGVGVKSLSELMAKAKAQPGRFNYGTPGAGTSFHFNTVVMNDLLGIDATHVIYRGEAPALIDLAGGSIQFMLAGQSARPYIQDGRLKPLAVTSSQRIGALPHVPTFTELGIKFKTDGWVGYVAAAGVPATILERLSEAFRTAIRQPKVREQFAAMGYEPVGNTRAEFRNLLKTRIDYYGGLIRSGAVKLEAN